jgi:RND family efflux transporter MFP subunit
MRRIHLSFFTWIALTSLILATACSSGNAAKAQPTPTPLPTPAAANKPTYTVKRGDVVAQVQFSARIIPAVQEELFFRVDGRVRKVYVRGGDRVTKGQVLADLISLDQMEMQAAQQANDLRKAEINLEMSWLRQQLAATQDSTWNAGYEIRQKMNAYEVELAQIALDETKLKAKNLDVNITDAQIISPLEGKVLSVNVLEGAEVRGFSPLVTVGDDTQLEVGGTLTTTQMQELAEGMVAQAELANRPGEKLSGKVRSLPYPYGTGGGTQTSSASSAAGKTVDNTTRIALDNPDSLKGFRLGDLVQVTVLKESKQNVLWLPPQAIRSFEGRNFVVVKTDNLPKRVDVRLGIKNEEQVEIISGMEEGQIAIAP